MNDDMIGFTQNGQIKVWSNANFAINSPESIPNLKNKIISEGDMVNQIFSTVE